MLSFHHLTLVALLLRTLLTTADDVNATFWKLQNYFDSTYPPKYGLTTLQAHNYHSKRCIAIEIAVAKRMFETSQFSQPIGDNPVLVGTPCLGKDSLGNMMTNYFETVACAHRTGMHYMGVAKVWEPSEQDKSSPFLDGLLMFLPHKNPVSSKSARSNLVSTCKCQGSCHERPKALWHQELELIKPLVWDSVNNHMNSIKIKSTVVAKDDLSTEAVGQNLSLIPEVAIHYRCGDNFVGHYGFLPFRHFKNLIPQTTSSIYILAENRSRKTEAKRHLAQKCDVIFQTMFSYMKKNFPTTQILIRRGDDIYTDFARLSLANITICSISTFCLWPAIINKGVAYFPKARLIVGGDTSIKMGFKWITEPGTIPGAQNSGTSPQQLAGLLAKD